MAANQDAAYMQVGVMAEGAFVRLLMVSRRTDVAIPGQEYTFAPVDYLYTVQTRQLVHRSQLHHAPPFLALSLRSTREYRQRWGAAIDRPSSWREALSNLDAVVLNGGIRLETDSLEHWIDHLHSPAPIRAVFLGTRCPVENSIVQIGYSLYIFLLPDDLFADMLFRVLLVSLAAFHLFSMPQEHLSLFLPHSHQ